MNWSYAQNIITGLVSLVKGMQVTMTTMLTPSPTVEWPRETAPLPPRFRGHIMLVADESTGFARCIACGACSRACPSNCIQVIGEKPEGVKKKSPTLFQLDFTKCSLCGLCVESCPVAALAYSRDYALAGPDRQVYSSMDLLTGFASPLTEQCHEL
ncbi:MAG: NADH-quinone oxidoreductase subunit I [Desulfobulbaceae bacterium]|nr:NADH-quinone oxidoreductase subunit I [Desulfobulbaceae bacterium]